jgi:hypothetical protein
MKLAVQLGGVVDVTFLGGVFSGTAVIGFALFPVTVHPMELRMGLFLFTSSSLSVNVGVRHKEIWLLKVPVRFLE